MKRLVFGAFALLSLSTFAADLFCLVDMSAVRCRDLYDVFMADDVCFRGNVGDATEFKKLGLTRSSGIKFLEGQVADDNRMLLFVEESGVEQLRYVNRCQ